MKKLIPQVIKNIYHLFQAVLANFIYGFPSKSIKVIGVTGTDGKTTTVQMIAAVLEEAGFKVAVASTINFKINGNESVNETKFTTSSSFKLQKFILEAVKARCEYLVLETSSHSLDQYRVWGVEYDTAVITNATREHLDYHETMEKYRKAKCKLFENVKTAIVNLDMEKPEEFLACGAGKIYLYSCHSERVKRVEESNKLDLSIACRGDISLEMTNFIKAENIELGVDFSKYEIRDTKYTIHLPGLFNIENALAATCVGLAENISLETIARALGKMKGIPGRLESIPNSKGLNIIVDFALTPHALTQLYNLIDNIKKPGAKVIGVFGACGERDRGKRSITGKIVSEHADYIILTDDEPYHEDPKRIIEEISAGIKSKIEGENFWKISDRREAIKKALLLAKPGDFVVITGMGSENSRGVGDKKIPWNDRKVILEELKKL